MATPLEYLDEQRHLLKTSLDRFYAGDLAEALPIATSIRVLILKQYVPSRLLRSLTGEGMDFVISPPISLKQSVHASVSIGRCADEGGQGS